MEIKFKDVSFCYNANTPVEQKVLENININFESGKVYGIIGKNEILAKGAG